MPVHSPARLPRRKIDGYDVSEWAMQDAHRATQLRRLDEENLIQCQHPLRLKRFRYSCAAQPCYPTTGLKRLDQCLRISAAVVIRIGRKRTGRFFSRLTFAAACAQLVGKLNGPISVRVLSGFRF